MDLIKLLFCLNISLLLVHEMDAIRCKEWNMFIFLKSMKENHAYLIFAIAHIPLYFALIYLLIFGSSNTLGILETVINIFLVFHWIIHIAFRNKQQNNFKGLFSRAVIHLMGILAFICIIARCIW